MPRRWTDANALGHLVEITPWSTRAVAALLRVKPSTIRDLCSMYSHVLPPATYQRLSSHPRRCRVFRASEIRIIADLMRQRPEMRAASDVSREISRPS